MKKWIGYILSLYILISAVFPCSMLDKCEENQHTEQPSNKGSKKDCNHCSPFSFCSTAYGFALNTINTLIEPMQINKSTSYSDYYLSSTSEYYSTLFQPPKAGM